MMSTNTRQASSVWRERVSAALYACLVTLISLPASAAIEIPNDPLTTGARVAPNILFILDDSGSMTWDFMVNPDLPMVSGGGLEGRSNQYSNSNGSRPSNDATSVYGRNYVANTIMYNPHRNYAPWVNSEGEPLSGGMSYSAAFSDNNNLTGSTNLRSSTRTFYVPKPSATDLSDITNYYRYQIHTDGRIVRSERVYGASVSQGLTDRGCQAGATNVWRWRGCAYATPTGRSEADELVNYATWYSYHRTRMKVAKAGVSAAFSALGENVRVGFRGLGNNNSSSWNPPFDIPVNDGNQGLFMDRPGAPGVPATSSRTEWFNRMQSARGNSGTPLRSALRGAGQYFSQSGSSGPYGPGAVSEQLACRQNFTILTTDGYWNGDSGFTVGNQDGEAGEEITGPGRTPFTYAPVAPYSDNRSNTLADVAMQFWKNDLRPDLENIVPVATNGSNPAFWQHMVTFGISIGLKGTLDQTSVAEVVADGGPRKNGVATSWPVPSNDHVHNIDDLLHAAVNGRGEFVTATDPDEFTAGLGAALAAIEERTSSFSNVSANSTSLDDDTRVFQASYVSGLWSGRLTSSAIVDGKVASIPSAVASIPASGRRVFTSSGAFPENVTDLQLSALTRTGGSANYPVTGAENAAYIAGERELELASGGSLRNRSSLLGDIVGSSPAYVDDTNTIYVGANDGMLHAFDADTLNEQFAFIPDGINWDALGSLSRPDYVHRYFVDGPVVVSTRSQTPGENILVATLGKGGKGLFALDVSQPDVFSESQVKWQAYATGGGSLDNMGFIQSAPVLAKVRSATGESRMAVVVANGINSTNERAVLLVYDLESGALIRQIDTGVGSSTDSNGLSGVVGWDQDGDGVVDTAYAGDMLGNVWKFDLSGLPSSWGVANAGDPMFTATDAEGKAQPITARLSVGMHPANFSTWVFFGTGRFMTIGDVEDRSVQSLYGIRDSGGTVTRLSLTERKTTVAGTRPCPTGLCPVRAFEQHAPLPATDEGWVIDLLEPPDQEALGERVVSEAQVINQALVVASIIPVNDACQSEGRGYWNALDAYTGTSLSGGSFFDLDGDGDFADETVGDGADAPPVGSVDLGVGMPTLPNLLPGLGTGGGTEGEIGEAPIRDDRYTGRVSWREEEGD